MNHLIMTGDEKQKTARVKNHKGKVNKLIDNHLSPHFKGHATLILVDGLLHAIVEQNPKESLRKSIKYNSLDF